jgi:hypothetical protein
MHSAVGGLPEARNAFPSPASSTHGCPKCAGAKIANIGQDLKIEDVVRAIS